MRALRIFALLLLLAGEPVAAAPPRLSIFHFDVNTGDATLIITPDKHGVLIDAGNSGRGRNPILEFMNRARDDGQLVSLDYTIVTHYDADHIGGMNEVYEGGWYPAIQAFDRGDGFLPPFDASKLGNCEEDLDAAEDLVEWGTAPVASCPASRHASCQIVEYFLAAHGGGRRKEMTPGTTLTLDHGFTVTAVVSNARDEDGNTADAFVPGRRDDCASNDLSVGLLVEFGDFRYFTAGDLTGNPDEDVADVESLVTDEAADVDVYHVNHHGSPTSSSQALLEAMVPTVAVVSNGTQHHHPDRTVIQRLLSLSPGPALYLTNRNPDPLAWQDDPDAIADDDAADFDGIVEISVWKRSYRVYRWRDGTRIDGGRSFQIKLRN